MLAPLPFHPGLEAVTATFSADSGIAVTLRYGLASGSSPQPISRRLADGEATYVVLLPQAMLDEPMRRRRGIAYLRSHRAAAVLRNAGIGRPGPDAS